MTEMTVTPMQELAIFSLSLISGVIGALIYDILRRIKHFLGINTLLVGIGDIISIVILAIVAYISVYIINDGKVRWYQMFAIFWGFGLYMKYISAYFMKLADFTVEILKIVGKYIHRFIFPFYKVSKNVFLGAFLWVKRCIRCVTKSEKGIFRKIKCIFRKI